MEIFWPLERRYVSVEEQQASCRREGRIRRRKVRFRGERGVSAGGGYASVRRRIPLTTVRDSGELLGELGQGASWKGVFSSF